MAWIEVVPAGPLGPGLPALAGSSLPWRETPPLRTCLGIYFKAHISLIE